MKKTIPYSHTVNFDTFEMWPIPTLPVRIMPRESFIPFPTEMLIDSGSEDTLLDAKIGESIGIDIKSGVEIKVGGITGGTIGYEHKVRIEFKKYELSPLGADVIFVYNLGTNGILGQRDFFAKYEVCFSRNKLEFTLDEIPTIKF